MDFRQVVARRRMVRRYHDRPVAPDAVDRVLATALRGSSAGFSQGVRLVVVTDRAQRSRIAEACGEAEHVARGRDPWLSVAPVHVIPCVRENDYRERYAEADKAAAGGPDHWSAPYWWVDAGAAVMLLLLAAVDEGLGAGILDLGHAPLVRELLDLPDDVRPVCLITLGHPAADPGPKGSATRGRRPVAEAVHWQRWSAAV